MIQIDKTRKHMCKHCAKCCHNCAITLTMDDLNREPRLYQYIIPVSQVDNPKTRLFMEENDMPFVINKGGRGKPCPFLMNNRCMIYETRPDICKKYPENGHCIKEKEEILCHLLRK